MDSKDLLNTAANSIGLGVIAFILLQFLLKMLAKQLDAILQTLLTMSNHLSEVTEGIKETRACMARIEERIIRAQQELETVLKLQAKEVKGAHSAKSKRAKAGA